MNDAEKLRKLADWFDGSACRNAHPEWNHADDEMQRDLRRIADSLPPPMTVTEAEAFGREECLMFDQPHVVGDCSIVRLRELVAWASNVARYLESPAVVEELAREKGEA